MNKKLKEAYEKNLSTAKAAKTWGPVLLLISILCMILGPCLYSNDETKKVQTGEESIPYLSFGEDSQVGDYAMIEEAVLIDCYCTVSEEQYMNNIPMGISYQDIYLGFDETGNEIYILGEKYSLGEDPYPEFNLLETMDIYGIVTDVEDALVDSGLSAGDEFYEVFHGRVLLKAQEQIFLPVYETVVTTHVNPVLLYGFVGTGIVLLIVSIVLFRVRKKNAAQAEETMAVIKRESPLLADVLLAKQISKENNRYAFFVTKGQVGELQQFVYRMPKGDLYAAARWIMQKDFSGKCLKAAYLPAGAKEEKDILSRLMMCDYDPAKLPELSGAQGLSFVGFSTTLQHPVNIVFLLPVRHIAIQIPQIPVACSINEYMNILITRDIAAKNEPKIAPVSTPSMTKTSELTETTIAKKTVGISESCLATENKQLKEPCEQNSSSAKTAKVLGIVLFVASILFIILFFALWYSPISPVILNAGNRLLVGQIFLAVGIVQLVASIILFRVWKKNTAFVKADIGTVKVADDISSTVNNGVMTITGTGPIPDYEQGKSPFGKQEVHTLIISEGITGVGDHAFFGLKNLTSVKLPSTLARVGQSAFAFCKALPRIEIPESVTEIGPCAFDNCLSLRRALIHPVIAKIGMWAFAGCPKLKLFVHETGTALLYAMQNNLEVANIDLPELPEEEDCTGFEEVLIGENDDVVYDEDAKTLAFVIGNAKSVVPVGQVEKIQMCTSDGGPFVDDMWTEIYVPGHMYKLMSENPKSQPIIFDTLGHAFPLDHEKIVEASTCTMNRTFVIYEKGQDETTVIPKEMESVLSTNSTGMHSKPEDKAEGEIEPLQEVFERMKQKAPSEFFAQGAIFDITRKNHADFAQIVRTNDPGALKLYFAALFKAYCEKPQIAGVSSTMIDTEQNDTDWQYWNVSILTSSAGKPVALCYMPIRHETLEARIIGIVIGDDRNGDSDRYYYCMLNKDDNTLSNVIENKGLRGLEEIGKINGRGFELMNSFMDCINKVSAVKDVHQCEQDGDAEEQMQLGRRLYSGDGAPRNLKAAAECFRRAAELGNADGQHNLGCCYEQGIGLSKDLASAAFWYQKAAEQGKVESQYNLGVAYNTGRGVSMDKAMAAKWMEKAAEQGLALAQFNIGTYYEFGNGVKVDWDKAFYWYQKASDQGFAMAQTNLALCYLKGNGTEKNPAKAVEWMEKAAAGGDENARDQLPMLKAFLNFTEKP